MADTLLEPDIGSSRPNEGDKLYVRASDGHVLPAMVVFGTDGNGNIIPVGQSVADSQLINTSYIANNITIGTSQVPVRVGGSNLANRKLIGIANYSSTSVFLGPSGVTATNGVKIVRGAVKYYEIGPAITMFLIRASGSEDVHIEEYS